MKNKKLILTVVIFLSLGLTSMMAQMTVKDVDGNVYKTITIGKQVWMSENLKTTKYRNGEVIGTTSPSGQDIRNLVGPKFQWAFGGKDSNSDVYGRLYTWYAITDDRGVCPAGWHVPTDAEWTALVTFLGGDVIAYSKLKESGEIHWLKYDTGSNETGFTALPGGIRNGRGPFDDMGTSGYWWSSTEYGATEAWYRYMGNSSGSLSRFLYLKRNGLSVRCVMNAY